MAFQAAATNGYFAHGYGLKAKGMGGVATALAQDSLGGANNPASMVWAGGRLDLGLDWFRPTREAERSGAGVATLNGTVGKGSEITGALMVAPRKSVDGSSLFNSVLGAGAGGNERISMRQQSFGLAWAQKF